LAAVLLWALAAVLAVVLAVLVLPVRVRLLARTDPAPHAEARVALLGGLAPGFRLRRGAAAGRPKRPRSGTIGPGRLGEMVRLGADLLARVRLERVEATGRYGLDDPADTGQLAGLIEPLVQSHPCRRIRLDIVPDFAGPRLSGRIEAVLSVRPVALAPPVLRFAWRAWGPGR
jgi:hypothetical protein